MNFSSLITFTTLFFFLPATLVFFSQLTGFFSRTLCFFFKLFLRFFFLLLTQALFFLTCSFLLSQFFSTQLRRFRFFAGFLFSSFTGTLFFRLLLRFRLYTRFFFSHFAGGFSGGFFCCFLLSFKTRAFFFQTGLFFSRFLFINFAALHIRAFLTYFNFYRLRLAYT